jgi:ribosomal protein L35
MPKMKSHKGTKKVVRVRPGGTVAIGRPGSRHNTGKKNTSLNRKNRAGSLLSKSDERRIKTLI